MSEESPSVADELPGPLTETTDFPSDTDRHLSEAEGENDPPPDADEEPWSDMAGETDIFAEDAFGPQDESMVLPTDTLVLLKQFGFCDEELESAADQSTNLRELSAGHSSDPATNPQDHAQDDVAGIDDDIVLPIESVEPSLEGHAEEGNDEEVTIEDYMNQLLARVSNGPSETITVTKTPKAKPTPEPNVAQLSEVPKPPHSRRNTSPVRFLQSKPATYRRCESWPMRPLARPLVGTRKLSRNWTRRNRLAWPSWWR